MNDDSPAPLPFDYHTAFARTVGWVTRDELETLRTKRIAIAGLGGVGGSHLLTLSRLGLGGFAIADFDHFELHNFNRQAGAYCGTIGQAKLDVLARMALEINPGLELKTFPKGIGRDNIHAFLDGADLYVDSLDFFAMEARRMVFAECHRLGIPALTAAPLGMGAATLVFMPGMMSFEDYFQLEGHDEEEQLLRFLLGLSPAMLQIAYLADPSAVNLREHRGPSTPMACELCAGIAATQALKILLGRGDIKPAPWGMHFDGYREKLVRTWRPGGNRNPLQRLGLTIARKKLSHALRQTPTQG